MKKLSNDENVRNLRVREQLRIAIIISCVVTVILALLNLFSNVGWIPDVSIIFALIAFVITALLRKKRDSIPINKSEYLMEIEEEVEKLKQNKKVNKKSKKSVKK